MPEVARGQQTDTVITGHGCDTTTSTDECSSKVFIGGIGVVRAGDKQTTHDHLSGEVCVPHTLALSSYSSKVFVEGKGVGRKSDTYGTEVISSGSTKVFAN